MAPLIVPLIGYRKQGSADRGGAVDARCRPALCADPDPATVSGTAPFETPGGNTVNSILLTPIPITQDNLDVVLEAGWIDEATLCKDVTAGSVAACG